MAAVTVAGATDCTWLIFGVVAVVWGVEESALVFIMVVLVPGVGVLGRGLVEKVGGIDVLALLAAGVVVVVLNVDVVGAAVLETVVGILVVLGTVEVIEVRVEVLDVAAGVVAARVVVAVLDVDVVLVIVVVVVVVVVAIDGMGCGQVDGRVPLRL